MELFSGEETRVYVAKKANALKTEVSEMSDSNIVTCDFDEWIDYLVNKYEITPLYLFEENIERTIGEVKVRRYNPFHKSSPWEKEYFEVDGVRITYRIPFDGNSDLFKTRPSTFIMTRFEAEKITSPTSEEYGGFYIKFEYTKQELEEKADKMLEYVQKNFENEFSSYRKMIGYVNAEINTYNNGLKSLATSCLETRKKKASSFAMISQMLEIPLKQSVDAPNTVPITIKKIAKKPISAPSPKPAKPEYCISKNDYENINNIILMNGTAMEKTARTYYQNNEEELRDHLLATLNTHYDNASGETFRKIGKTDIHIEFDNKAAYIGECKIWHGEKMFADAVQQVLNYSTWKDTKVSVIIFNKDNQSFFKILEKIQEWINKNTKSHIKKKENIWSCIFYRKDMEVNVSLEILVFDLYVDKNQFKDSRF